MRTRTSRPRPGRWARVAGSTALVAALAAAPLLGASPAAADDEFEIDQRLERAGLPGAVTYLDEGDAAGVGDGVHVHVPYASEASTAEEYAEETRRGAEAVWDHLDYRVLTVTFVALDGLGDGTAVAPAAWGRADLQAEFGDRDGRLDDGGALGPWADDPGAPPVDGLAVAVAATAVVAGVGGAGLVALVVALRGRRRRAAPEPWAWAAPAAPGAPGPGAPGPWAAPPAPRTVGQAPVAGGEQTAGVPAAAAGTGPWQTPGAPQG